MDKVDKLERTVQRLMRRSRKVAKAIITPIPVSNCIMGKGISGIVLRYMFVCPGVIGKGGVFLDKKPKSGAVVTFSIENDLGGSRKSYNISRRNLIFEPKIEVDTWDRLSVMFAVVDPEEDVISEVWTGFLWTPTVKDVKIKNYLIDELESDLLEE